MEITKSKGKLKWRASIYDITINTNKSLIGVSAEKIEEIKKKLEIFIRSVITSEKMPKLIYGAYTGKPAGEENFRNISVKSAIEANEHGRSFLHSHSIIRVEHRIPIKINITLIKNTFYKYMDETLTFEGKYLKPYINIKAVPDTAYNMENYVSGENRGESDFLRDSQSFSS
jgi:hypothetical protein